MTNLLRIDSFGEDFENNDKRIARKKQGRAVEWKKKFEFDKEKLEEIELDIKTKKKYIIQLQRQVKHCLLVKVK